MILPTRLEFYFSSKISRLKLAIIMTSHNTGNYVTIVHIFHPDTIGQYGINESMTTLSCHGQWSLFLDYILCSFLFPHSLLKLSFSSLQGKWELWNSLLLARYGGSICQISKRIFSTIPTSWILRNCISRTW